VKVAAALALVAALEVTAHADPPPSDTPGFSYLYDGGAVPLFWLPALGGWALGQVHPRSTPLGFSSADGGASKSSWEIPQWSVDAAGAGVAAAFVLAGDGSRWYHAKGMVESLATSALVVSALKPLFGRHRPDWTATDKDQAESESFPSGHTTAAFAIATYSALYLHDHVEGNHTLEYIGIFAAAGLVGTERVVHHRHFVSDVAAGAVLGAATSYFIYRYQDSRFAGARAHDLALQPTSDAHSHTLSLTGTF
jgi:membrane-associated phospholipid phosphatase